jgi:hypothetical protein
MTTTAQGLALLQATLASFPDAMRVLLKDERTRLGGFFERLRALRTTMLFLLDPQQS